MALDPAFQRATRIGLRHAGASRVSIPLAGVLAFGCPAILVAFRRFGVPEFLSEMSASALAPTSQHALLGYSDEVLWSAPIAIGVSLHVVGVARLSCHWNPGQRVGPAKAVKWLAGATFSIHAIHYPVLHLLDATLPDAVFMRDFLLLSLTATAGRVFARIFERSIATQRQTIKTWIWGPGFRQAPDR